MQNAIEKNMDALSKYGLRADFDETALKIRELPPSRASGRPRSAARFGYGATLRKKVMALDVPENEKQALLETINREMAPHIAATPSDGHNAIKLQARYNDFYNGLFTTKNKSKNQLAIPEGLQSITLKQRDIKLGISGIPSAEEVTIENFFKTEEKGKLRVGVFPTGSGKTTNTVKKAIELARKNPKAKIMVVTINKNMCMDYRDIFAKEAKGIKVETVFSRRRVAETDTESDETDRSHSEEITIDHGIVVTHAFYFKHKGLSDRFFKVMEWLETGDTYLIFDELDTIAQEILQSEMEMGKRAETKKDKYGRERLQERINCPSFAGQGKRAGVRCHTCSVWTDFARVESPKGIPNQVPRKGGYADFDTYPPLQPPPLGPPEILFTSKKIIMERRKALAHANTLDAFSPEYSLCTDQQETPSRYSIRYDSMPPADYGKLQERFLWQLERSFCVHTLCPTPERLGAKDTLAPTMQQTILHICETGKKLIERDRKDPSKVINLNPSSPGDCFKAAKAYGMEAPSFYPPHYGCGYSILKWVDGFQFQRAIRRSKGAWALTATLTRTAQHHIEEILEEGISYFEGPSNYRPIDETLLVITPTAFGPLNDTLDCWDGTIFFKKTKKEMERVEEILKGSAFRPTFQEPGKDGFLKDRTTIKGPSEELQTVFSYGRSAFGRGANLNMFETIVIEFGARKPISAYPFFLHEGLSKKETDEAVLEDLSTGLAQQAGRVLRVDPDALPGTVQRRSIFVTEAVWEESPVTQSVARHLGSCIKSLVKKTHTVIVPEGIEGVLTPTELQWALYRLNCAFFTRPLNGISYQVLFDAIIKWKYFSRFKEPTEDMPKIPSIDKIPKPIAKALEEGEYASYRLLNKLIILEQNNPNLDPVERRRKSFSPQLKALKEEAEKLNEEATVAFNAYFYGQKPGASRKKTEDERLMARLERLQKREDFRAMSFRQRERLIGWAELRKKTKNKEIVELFRKLIRETPITKGEQNG